MALETKRLAAPDKANRPAPPVRYGRGGRIVLLALILATVVFVAALLFARFRLDAIRQSVTDKIAQRLGAAIDSGPVTVNGLRGLRVDDVHLMLESEGGPTARLHAPIVFADIDLDQLVLGHIAFDRIRLDELALIIERPEDAAWFSGEGFDFRSIFESLEAGSFRLTGTNGRLELKNIVAGTELVVQHLDFDISRLPDAADLNGYVRGYAFGDAEKPIETTLRYDSFQDFDLRLQTRNVTPSEINLFLPAQHQFVAGGIIDGTIWLDGRPDERVQVSVDGDFRDFELRDQPAFLPMLTGGITATAVYDPAQRELRIANARAASEDLRGTLAGTVRFPGDYPVLDLTVEATQIPLVQIAEELFQQELTRFGDTQIELDDARQLVYTLAGPTNDTHASARIGAASGRLVFQPKQRDWPETTVHFENLHGTWDSQSGAIAGGVAIVDGSLNHSGWGIEVGGLSGVLAVQNNTLTNTTPIIGTMRGEPIVASVTYDLENETAEGQIKGVLRTLETTLLSDKFRKTQLRGDLAVEATVRREGKKYLVSADFDAARAEIAYDWWFKKPVGIETQGHAELAYEPGLALSVELTEAQLASSPLTLVATLDYNADAGEWRALSATATSDALDITAVGKTLNLPYRVTGGMGTEAYFSWERDLNYADGWRQTSGARFDDLILLPLTEDATTPMQVKGVTVAAELVNDDETVGNLTLTAAGGAMPSLGETWFVPIRDRPQQERKREWTFDLLVNHLSMPPWVGDEFTARAYTNPSEVGFNSFSAKIESGTIEGDYHAIRAANSYSTNVRWEQIPSKYLLEHLGYPGVLTGSVTGEVSYALDRDDRSTLNGQGAFTVEDGEFSADFLYGLLENEGQSQSISLPPSLAFDALAAEVAFERDIVATPAVSLQAPGLTVTGQGQYIRDGDMNYNIRLAISPEMAASMPLLLEYFNVEGHKLARQNIELAFRIEGPVFNPTGRLAELPPASVTLVSGALEMTSEALKVIDLPRRILLDLVRLGGGVFTRPNGR